LEEYYILYIILYIYIYNIYYIYIYIYIYIYYASGISAVPDLNLQSNTRGGIVKKITRSPR